MVQNYQIVFATKGQALQINEVKQAQPELTIVISIENAHKRGNCSSNGSFLQSDQMNEIFYLI